MSDQTSQIVDLHFAEYNFAQEMFHNGHVKTDIDQNNEIIKKILKIKNKKDRMEAVYNLIWIPFAIGTYAETIKEIDRIDKETGFIMRKDLDI